MIFKRITDQLVVHSPTCGEVREILTQKDYNSLSLAVCMNIKLTEGHYHLTFDEIYFVLDGEITLETFDPSDQKRETFSLKANELFVVSKGIHHKIVRASETNRLCVVASPPFHADDEHLSDKI